MKPKSNIMDMFYGFVLQEYDGIYNRQKLSMNHYKSHQMKFMLETEL